MEEASEVDASAMLVSLQNHEPMGYSFLAIQEQSNIVALPKNLHVSSSER